MTLNHSVNLYSTYQRETKPGVRPFRGGHYPRARHSMSARCGRNQLFSHHPESVCGVYIFLRILANFPVCGLNEDPPSRCLSAYVHHLPTPSSSLTTTLPFPFLAVSRSVHSWTLHHADSRAQPPTPEILSLKSNTKYEQQTKGCRSNGSSIHRSTSVLSRSHPKASIARTPPSPATHEGLPALCL